jgi:anti-sigma factor RsiW
MPHNNGNEAGKMYCDNTMHVMNDFLDRTLSETEEQKVKSHLEDCEKCRDEFHSLKNADSVLRQVVSGMVAGIDVPGNLGDRIEKIIVAENRKKTTV